ncbi:MAG: hypothetical protein ACOYU2_00250 [Nitrospirota bacterium]
MQLALVDRPPTTVEKFRLLLSTYQDGSGMLAQKQGRTLPGWRDFERAVAVAFNGESQENKFIFDVLLTDPIGLLWKAKDYFPEQWDELMKSMT